MAITASDRRLIALHQPLRIRSFVTADTKIVKRALRPFFIAIFVSGILRITIDAVTSDALHKNRHAARLSSLMVTADALGALLCLMSKLAVRIQVRFVMAVTKRNNP